MFRSKREIVFFLVLFVLFGALVALWPDDTSANAKWTDYGFSSDSVTNDPYGLLE